jgi:hypothetical protein
VREGKLSGQDAGFVERLVPFYAECLIEVGIVLVHKLDSTDGYRCRIQQMGDSIHLS